MLCVCGLLLLGFGVFGLHRVRDGLDLRRGGRGGG